MLSKQYRRKRGSESGKRKRAEADLLRPEQQYRQLLESVQAIVWEAVAITWQFSFVSQGAEAILGYPVEQWLREPNFWVNHIHPEDREHAVAFCRKSTADGKDHEFEYRAVAADGRVVWLRDIVRVVKDAKGKPLYLRGVMVDVTERKRAEAEAERFHEQTKKQAVELETANRQLSSLLAELSRLYSALTPLGAAETQQQKLERATDRLMEATGADAALVRILDKTTNTYAYRYQRGFPTSYLETIQIVGKGSAVDTAYKGEPVIAADISQDRRLKGKAQVEAGFHSCAFLPFKAKDEVRGVIHLASRKLGYFSEERKDHLLAIARLVGIVFENSELFNEISGAKNELEKANKVKDEFLGFISHELKTPVNSVLGYAAMMQDRILGEINEQQEMALREVLDCSRELLGMINSLLEATKVEAGAIKVMMVETVLGNFLDELKSGYNVPLDKELALIWDYPSNLPAIKTDSAKLKHILQNLINNAIKYTDRGDVTVSVQIKERRGQQAVGNGKVKFVEFKVADTGIGIPKEELPFIFEMFRQVEGCQRRSSGGVGLGLHIVKKFTELLGGEIGVESEPGKGSTFTVTVPSENNP